MADNTDSMMQQQLVPDADIQQRNVALACHLLGFCFFVFPLGNIIAPLILWLLKRDNSTLVDEHGKEAINFQISFTLWFAIIAGVGSILFWTLVIPLLAGLAAFVLAMIWLVSIIRATLRAQAGAAFRYPWTLRLVN